MAAFNVVDAAFDFCRPCALDLVIIKYAADQSLCEPYPFLCREFEGLRFNGFKLG